MRLPISSVQKERKKRETWTTPLEGAPMNCERAGAPQICVYPDRLFWTDVMPLHHVPRTAKYLNSKKNSLESLRAKPVIANGDGGEVERSQLPADLLERLAVGGIASEPEAALPLGRPGGNCIKIGLPGKLILRYYFQKNRTSRRPFLLLRFSFPGRPLFIQFIPGRRRRWSC